MAIVDTPSYLDQESEEAKRLRLQQEAAAGGASGGPASAGTGTGVGAGPQGPRGPALGNLYQQFGQANAGNTRFAQAINQNQAKVGSDFQAFATPQIGSFKTASDAGSQRNHPKLVANVTAHPRSQTPEAIAQFQAQRTGQYTGPVDFGEFAPGVRDRAAGDLASENINDVGALAGIMQRAGGGRGAGKQNLNMSLLGSDDNSSLLSQGYQGIKDTLGAPQQGGATYAQANQAQTTAANASAQSALDKARNESPAAQKQTLRVQDEIKAALRSGKATDQQLATIGMTREQWRALKTDIAAMRSGPMPKGGMPAYDPGGLFKRTATPGTARGVPVTGLERKRTSALNALGASNQVNVGNWDPAALASLRSGAGATPRFTAPDQLAINRRRKA